MTGNLAEIKNLNIVYQTKKNAFGGVQNVYAVNGLDLEIKKGEILAIAGESGCGKSTLAKALMKLIDVKSGKILIDGKDILAIKTREEIKDFYKKVQMIFQNPYSSLNPKMKIGQILSEPLEINTNLTKEQIKKAVLETIKKVGLDETFFK